MISSPYIELHCAPLAQVSVMEFIRKITSVTKVQNFFFSFFFSQLFFKLPIVTRCQFNRCSDIKRRGWVEVKSFFIQPILYPCCCGLTRNEPPQCKTSLNYQWTEAALLWAPPLPFPIFKKKKKKPPFPTQGSLRPCETSSRASEIFSARTPPTPERSQTHSGECRSCKSKSASLCLKILRS